MKPQKIIKFIIDLIFPKTCLNCGKEGSWICAECLSKIALLNAFSCPVCKKRLPLGKICDTCKPKTKLSRFFAVAIYQNPLSKEAIHKLKYDFIKDLAEPLAKLLTDFLKNIQFDSGFLIVPVPLHKKRERERGFNQSAEISKSLSKYLKIPLESGNLCRIKNIPPQVEIQDLEMRKKNVQGAFSIKNPEIFKKKKILLIDDVYTTGSTMEECAKILKKAGAKEIWGVVVAR